MNKYKVEFTESEKFIIDILANNEEEAKELAEEKWQEVCKNGTFHYLQYGDSETDITNIFNVTNTDDPFDAEFEQIEEDINLSAGFTHKN